MCSSIPRRDFVRRLPVVGAGLAMSASLTASGCAGVPYLVPTESPEGLALSLASFGAEDAAFVHRPGMERPIYVSRSGSDGWTAVLASCTHRGCQPDAVGDRLVCPCHGSEFTTDGLVLQGPAQSPLRRFEVVREEGQLIILTGSRR